MTTEAYIDDAALDEIAWQICHAVEQRSDDCDMEMHTRVLGVLKYHFNRERVYNPLPK